MLLKDLDRKGNTLVRSVSGKKAHLANAMATMLLTKGYPRFVMPPRTYALCGAEIRDILPVDDFTPAMYACRKCYK